MQFMKCSMLSIDFSTICAPNFIQNTDILILLGIRVPKTKDLKPQLLTITSKVGFQTIFLYQLWLANDCINHRGCEFSFRGEVKYF